jgi:propanol-preferring alcohol dehydrogenase
VLACGVCHTDLHIVEGELELPRLPLIPGHEVVGIVVALGPDRGAEGSPGGGRPRGGSAEADASTAGTAGDEARVGDRVGVTWLYDACWDCAYCRRGLENLCPSVTFTGLDADGGYAEYMVAPARVLLPLPPGFSDIQASPLLCAGVIGYRALRLAGLQPGERLALFGFGASAHLALQVALHWGCEVYVYTRSPEHQAMARRLGAVWAGPAEAVLGPGRPPRVARAVSFAPSGSLIPLALQALEPAGVLAINAIHLDRVPDFPYRLLWGERVLRSVANVTRADGTQFLELAAEIPLSVETEVYDLEDANQVLLRLKRREIQGAAVLRVAGMGHGEA